MNDAEKLMVKGLVSDLDDEHKAIFEDKCNKIREIVYEGGENSQAAGLLALSMIGLEIE